MKNSEWGAVAYLTYSVYGRNGNELGVNQCTSYYTGGGPGIGDSSIYNSAYTFSESTFSSDYAYNTAQGQLASTTGNIYGIYDMSGGAYEHTASYVDGNTTNLEKYGADLVNAENAAYKQAYGTAVGDAVAETSTWKGEKNYPTASSLFFRRGGYSKEPVQASIFGYYSSNGYTYDSGGFRPVICITSKD